jgi:antitoxin CptB
MAETATDERIEDRCNKLRFRAWRRGFREADLILGPFADTHVRSLSPAQIDAFETLLDQPDHDLFAWIMGVQPAPEAFEGDVLEMIRTFRFSAREARTDHGA